MVEFSENLRVVAIKLLKLIQFASPNLSICFNFVRYYQVPLYGTLILYGVHRCCTVYFNFVTFTVYHSEVHGVGARSDRRRFAVHSPFIEKSMHKYI